MFYKIKNISTVRQAVYLGTTFYMTTCGISLERVSKQKVPLLLAKSTYLSRKKTQSVDHHGEIGVHLGLRVRDEDSQAHFPI